MLHRFKHVQKKKNQNKQEPIKAGDRVFIKVPAKWKDENDELYEHEAEIIERKLNLTCKVKYVRVAL